jgi:hypothetical protein
LGDGSDRFIDGDRLVDALDDQIRSEGIEQQIISASYAFVDACLNEFVEVHWFGVLFFHGCLRALALRAVISGRFGALLGHVHAVARSNPFDAVHQNDDAFKRELDVGPAPALPLFRWNGVTSLKQLPASSASVLLGRVILHVDVVQGGVDLADQDVLAVTLENARRRRSFGSGIVLDCQDGPRVQ